MKLKLEIWPLVGLGIGPLGVEEGKHAPIPICVKAEVINPFGQLPIKGKKKVKKVM